MTDTRWMTYDEVAAAFGIAPDSARRLVARRKWARRLGNDGKTRVGVSAENLPASPPALASDVLPDSPPGVGGNRPPTIPPDITPVINILREHIDRLEKELSAVKEERDRERARLTEMALAVSEVGALKALLENEKARLDDVRGDRDRWAAQAKQLAAAETKPWWRRLAG